MMLRTTAFVALSLASFLTQVTAPDGVPKAKPPQESQPNIPQRAWIEVLDAESGKTIQNARVSRVPEAVAPIWGEFWSNASGLTDAQGLVTLAPQGPGEGAVWLIVQAEGYAPHGQFGFPKPSARTTVIQLEPAVPAMVRVLDFRGEPMPLVYLGQCVGCGHTPDVLGTFTDHGGRATLNLVGKNGGDIADVFPVGHNVHMSELAVPWEEAMTGEVSVMVKPGATISGRVIGKDGLPVTGVSVGTDETHRGPWAVTDQAGRFQLVGLSPGGATELQVRDMTGQLIGLFGESRVGVERVLQLPSDLRPPERGRERATLSLALDVVGYGSEGKDYWEGHIPVTIWDPMTGWMMTSEATPGETLELELRPGTYIVEHGGMDSPFAPEISGPVTLRSSSATVITTALPPIEPRQLKVLGAGTAQGIELFHACGTRQSLAFDRVEGKNGLRTGVIENYVAPHAAVGIWVDVDGERFRPVPFTLAPHDPYSLEGLVARRR